MMHADQVDRRPRARGRPARRDGRDDGGLRTRTGFPAGSHSSSSPTATLPETTVPVTTVPCPATVKDRSIAMRKIPASSAGRTREQSDSSARLSSSIPCPVVAEVRTIAAPSRNDPRTSERMSSSTMSIQPGSARSHFVMTTRPPERPRSRRISRCSRVCGMTESSAATISMARSSPDAPASMLRMNRSWPGTSTIASRYSPSSQRREAQVDRDPPLLLGRQAVGVDPGEGPHQRRLAVVDVAGGPDHEVAYRFVHGLPSVRKPIPDRSHPIRSSLKGEGQPEKWRIGRRSSDSGVEIMRGRYGKSVAQRR